MGEGLLPRSRCNIPQTDGVIPTPTGERCPIRTECNAIDRARVFGEGLLQCPRCNIPQTEGVIPTCSRTSEGLSIRAERNAPDLVRAFDEGGLHRSCCNIPQTDGAIPTPTSEGAAIRAERNARDTVLVAGEQCNFLIGSGIVEPHPDRTCNRQQRSIGRIRKLIYLTFAQAQCRPLG